MPLISIEKLPNKVLLGLWQLNEQPDDFDLPQKKGILAQCRSAVRQTEKLATYALLATMIGDDDLLVAHEKSGRPILEGWHISISHTRGYVAVILSRYRRVAVDIEYVANRVNKIASKFIREDEKATTTLTRLLHWSAKETAYKYYSEQQLNFFEIRLQHFQPESEGILILENLRSNRTLSVCYRQNNAYVLTYAI
ncbi:MAG: 4'-phosphopantetheinyl transferase superfamily protein [Prevotella sp.]|nr:4'-phosphopantetheinyl transferase superfamily protein [Prevotella sp.]